jgi:hypothetical protein
LRWILTTAVAVSVAISASAFAQSKRTRPGVQNPPTQTGQPKSQSNEDAAPQQPQITVNVVPPPKTENERKQEEEERRQKAETDQRLTDYTGELAKFTSWLFYATVALATATIGLLVFAFVQSRDMKNSIEAAKRSADVAERALITTERAFVFLEDFDYDHSIGLRGSGKEFIFLTIKPRWRNSGKTPTRNMTIKVNWTHWQGDNLTGIDDYLDMRPTKMFLGPNATEWSEAISIPGNVATAALKGIEKINIWGRVDYEDIFDETEPHFTECCYRLHFIDDGPAIRIQFVSFSDHNRSDENSRAKRGA